MTASRWVAAVAALATMAAPAMAGIPADPPPVSVPGIAITGEAPLLLDADGVPVSLTELDGIE